MLARPGTTREGRSGNWSGSAPGKGAALDFLSPAHASGTMDNGDGLVRDARTGTGLVHALIYDRQGGAMVRSLAGAAEEVGAITRDLRTGNGGLHQVIYGTDLSQALANVNQISARDAAPSARCSSIRRSTKTSRPSSATCSATRCCAHWCGTPSTRRPQRDPPHSDPFLPPPSTRHDLPRSDLPHPGRPFGLSS